MKQLIMTTPSGFDEGANAYRAFQQWNELRNALIAAGVDVIVMPETPSNHPEAVFVSDMGAIVDNDFIVSRFKYAERRADESFIAQWFQDHRFDILYNPSFDGYRHDTFEGSDVMVSVDRKHVWFGFGLRSSWNFKRHLDDLFDESDLIVRPLMLKDTRFTHLTTCFNPLDTGDLLWYPDAFDSHSQMVIESWYKDKAIAVSEEDAVKFACNAVSVDDKIIMTKVSASLSTSLKSRGYTVVEVELDEFNNMCKRLTLEVFK